MLCEQSKFRCWAKKKIPEAAREPRPQPRHSETKEQAVTILGEA